MPLRDVLLNFKDIMIEKIRKIADLLIDFNNYKGKAIFQKKVLQQLEKEVRACIELDNKIKKLNDELAKADKNNEEVIVRLLQDLYQCYHDYNWSLGFLDDLIGEMVASYSNHIEKNLNK